MNILQQFGSLKEEVPSPNYRLWRGFINWQDGYSIKLGDSNWVKEYDFCDHPYRVVWINIMDASIFTYCEGDLTLKVFSDRAAFYLALAECAEYYKNNR